MAYKCTWCKDTGKYYPLQGPAEPCRECAAFATVPPLQTIGAISVSQISQTLMVMDLTPEQCDIIRDNIPYSGQGFDVCRRTAYIATWKEHVPQILDLLGWNALDVSLRVDGEHWVMEHKPKSYVLTPKEYLAQFRQAKVGDTIRIERPPRYTVK